MNEITKIHLGRTAFTIAVDAHRELRRYLDAIKKQVGPKHQEVLEEVELRMAELLTEKGITAEKVVVAKDITYLKEQLGSPSDFEDEDGDEDEPADKAPDTGDETKPRRLFRDPRDQILGGVASGLGSFFGIDPWIFRIIFIAMTFAGASGVLIYLVLWLLVPKAQSNSDFLQMKGKSVTVDALTDYVESQEFKRDAQRVGNRVGQALTEIFRLLATAIRGGVGTVLTVAALVASIWTLIMGVYILTGPERLFQAGRLFPVGTQETVLLLFGMGVLLSGFGLLLSSGIAFLRQKWPLPLWTSAALGAIFVVGLAVSVALGAQAAPRIRDRYNAARTTETRQVGTFDQLEITGDEAIVRYEYADKPSVDIRSIGPMADEAIKTEVKDGKLAITVQDTRSTTCDWFCIDTEQPVVTVRAPRLGKIVVHENVQFDSHQELHQDKLTLVASEASDITLSSIRAKDVIVTENRPSNEKQSFYGTRTIELSGITSGLPGEGPGEDIWSHHESGLTIGAADSFTLNAKQPCNRYNPQVYLWEMPTRLTINDQLFSTEDALLKEQSDDTKLPANCVSMR